jgi:Dolichyl-phosphate-mannose-protein mannosyltransferase
VKRLVLAATLACLAGYIYVYARVLSGPPIRSDAFSYYVYLPSWLLHHDASLDAVADDCCGGEFPAWTAIIRWPRTGRWVDAHPIGEALLIAPFFAAAHALTRWSNLSPDGFSLYYQHAAGLAGLAYTIAGLWFLRRLLRRHFTEPVVTGTLAALLFGTSLYHYATFDSVWSHAFSFALCAALLERFDAWTRESSTRDAIILGLIAGLTFLVRHTNVMIPAALGTALAIRQPSFRRAAPAAALVALACAIPQLLIYHAASGHWIISSYGDLGFTWTTPHVAGVLFSPRKGLFFWAPLLLAAVAGLAWLPPALRQWCAPILVVLVIDTYLIASWWDWQFGASYGHRGFVDVYPLLAPGLAAAFARIPARSVLRAAAAAAVILLCALSVFQMLQYWHGVMPMSDVTWEQYKELFLKPW